MMMKKILFVVMALVLAGCAEKKQLSEEEQWHGYCVSVGNAARSITLDRQNGIEKQQALDYANKIEDQTTHKFIIDIIEHVYTLPANQLKNDPDALREQLKQKFIDQCVATPHDGLPDYKQF